jgi:hypothetical protein
MEYYLRIISNYYLDKCVQLLPLAEFTYHNAIYHSTWMTPCSADYNNHPPMKAKQENTPSSTKTETLKYATVQVVAETHWLMLWSIVVGKE